MLSHEVPLSIRLIQRYSTFEGAYSGSIFEPGKGFASNDTGRLQGLYRSMTLLLELALSSREISKEKTAESLLMIR